MFQLMKKHYSRYTPEMVERVCGIPQDKFLEMADTLIANSGRERTEHAHLRAGLDPAQRRRADDPRRRDRAAAAGQHRAPGRRHHGHARPRLDPGLQRHPDPVRAAARLPADAARQGRGPHARATTSRAAASTTGWWSHFDEYIVSLCKAWFGDAATEENDFGFPWLPKISGNHSHYPTIIRALDGGLDGFFVMGQNPAVGSAHSGLQRRALARHEVAGGARPRRAGDGQLLEGLAGGALGRAAHARTSRPRCS